MMNFSPEDKKLLNHIQGDLPIAERPYQALGEKVGLSEAQTIERVQWLKDQKVIRQISAIFDTRSLGYRSSLVAMRIDSSHLDASAAAINAHPGVSHNYRRNHAFNLWFTVAVPPNSRLGLEQTVDFFHTLARAESTRLMPTLKLFKIGVKLDITGEESPTGTEPPAYTDAHRRQNGQLTELQRQIILEMQEDLPVVERPFTPVAERLGVSLDQLFQHLHAMITQGQLRRVSAVLHHRQAGFVANAMGVWAVPQERITEVGEQMASFRAVSHCYQRPVYPDWPYSIFTMVHGHNVKECQEILSAIEQKTGITQYEALYSTKEYKKVRVRYFTPELDEWERRFPIQSGKCLDVHREPESVSNGY